MLLSNDGEGVDELTKQLSPRNGVVWCQNLAWQHSRLGTHSKERVNLIPGIRRFAILVEISQLRQRCHADAKLVDALGMGEARGHAQEGHYGADSAYGAAVEHRPVFLPDDGTNGLEANGKRMSTDFGGPTHHQGMPRGSNLLNYLFCIIVSIIVSKP